MLFLWFQKKKELDKKKLLELESQKKEMQVKFEQEILRSQLELQEQTLKNISQEIHDNVGQVLSLAKLNLNMMDARQPDQLQRKIDSALEQVSKAINDLRDLSKSFNTDTISELGLIKAIAMELDIVARADAHKTSFKIKGKSCQLPAQQELILFRIVQEALHNIVKHAAANSIRVEADYTTDKLELCITDNGTGFDLTPLEDPARSSFGLGIRNMHNRARMIGASFQMSSTDGEGTTIQLSIPISEPLEKQLQHPATS